MKLQHCASLILGLLSSLAGAQSTGVKSRLPISEPQIAEALYGAGAAIAPERARVLAEITAENSPSIAVNSVEKVGETRASFSMTCTNCSTRLPFIVVTDWFTASDLDQVLKNLKVNAPVRVERQHAQNNWVVRAGKNVALLMEGEKMRIFTRAVCLEPGEVGSAIKVRTLDSKHIYRAQVVDGNTVKVAL
jgi:flagella basal body P-ring formation protein FlgA